MDYKTTFNITVETVVSTEDIPVEINNIEEYYKYLWSNKEQVEKMLLDSDITIAVTLNTIRAEAIPPIEE